MKSIASSPLGAAGYIIGGDRGAFVGAAYGQIIFSFGGVSGEGFLSKPQYIVEKGEFHTEGTMPNPMSNVEARIWYNQKLNTINTDIAYTEKNARSISVQRNAFKLEARLLMSDREAAKALDRTDPIKPFDYYAEKYKAQGYEGESLWKKIIESGKKPNAEVNRKLNIK